MRSGSPPARRLSATLLVTAAMVACPASSFAVPGTSCAGPTLSAGDEYLIAAIKVPDGEDSVIVSMANYVRRLEQAGEDLRRLREGLRATEPAPPSGPSE
ncbi:MAG: hypothetical protein AAGH15_24345 [Myxococcota bacterium]